MVFKALSTNDPIPLLILDVNGFCDLQCIMCPQGRDSNDPGYQRGRMDFELWKSIIDELCAGHGIRANAVLPFWNGEGMLNPQFAEMISYAADANRRNKGFNVFSLHTNFNSAGEDICSAIVDSEMFGPLTLSLDAITSETYNQIRQGGNFDRIMKNIDFLIEYRQKTGRQYPSLIFQFIVMKENIHEAEAFYNHWSGRLKDAGRDFKVAFDDTVHMDRDVIFFRRLNVDTNEDQVEAEKMHRDTMINLGFAKPMEAEGGRIIRSDEYRVEKRMHLLNHSVEPVRPPCVGLWQHFGVRWDGMCSACCMDFKTEQKLGNVAEEGLWNIWTGEKLKQFRLWHIAGEFHKIPVCAPCRNQPFHYLSDGEMASWLRDIERDDLIIPTLKRLGRIA